MFVNEFAVSSRFLDFQTKEDKVLLLEPESFPRVASWELSKHTAILATARSKNWMRMTSRSHVSSYILAKVSKGPRTWISSVMDSLVDEI